jgi:hypothetical protein
MQTYRVTASVTSFETVDVEADSTQEAERLVQDAYDSGEIWDDPKFKYISSSDEGDWTVLPEYTGS